MSNIEEKSKLCKELKEYSSRTMTSNSLDNIDKLAHAIKNIDKVIKGEEEKEYSGNYSGRRSMDGRSYDSSYDRSYDNSYDRSYDNSYRRDSMGRYSRDEEMVNDLRSLKRMAVDEATKETIQKMINKFGNM